MKPEPIPEEARYDPPPKATVFCGFIYTPELDLGEVLRVLEREWGPVAFISRRYPFDYTPYYEREMGSPLARRFATFGRSVEQDALPGLKWQAKGVEDGYRGSTGGRRVNIDPGLLLLDRLQLATTKPCSHRLYLGEGIYGDLTLRYHHGSFRPLPWTYPDYREAETVRIMNSLRERCLLQERTKRRGWIE
jgi:hypothetical protein